MGNVGINTRAPLYALDVPLGTISANKFRMTDGAANGKVLMSYSDGTAYWATPSSGGGDSPWQTSAANHIYYNPGYSPGAGGNVGIGTDAPLAKLDIDGDLRIKETLSFNGANNGNITFGTASEGRTLKITSNYDGHKGNIAGIIINLVGNVGIGKDNPSMPLDVNGTIKATQLQVSATTTNNFKMLNGRGNGKILQSDAYGNASWQLAENINGLGLWEETNEIAYYDGSVGIGTTSTGTHKLAVNGSINATLIKVTLDVPSSDYVFEDDYKLMPLDELEEYVNIQKRLPEVMSAEEFAKNGYSLGEMDDILLRKVEELTLYVIDQDKAIKQQQELLEKQQQLIDQLLQEKK